MKSLPISGASGPQWNSKLLKDLIFIKKNLRFPLGKITIIPLLAMFPILTLSFITLSKKFSDPQRTNLAPAILVLLLLLVMPILGFLRLLSALKFKMIATPFFAVENMELLQRFLKSQHLAFHRHPDAPELFQILSRPLGNFKNEQREVMVFIADDKRILINSHFTEQKFGVAPSSKNAKRMAASLEEWLRAQVQNTESAVMPL
jgi:hypothetical protein